MLVLTTTKANPNPLPQVLATTKADYVAFGERLARLHAAPLAPSAAGPSGVASGPGQGMNAVVFASRAALEAANAELAKRGKPILALKDIL